MSVRQAVLFVVITVAWYACSPVRRTARLDVDTLLQRQYGYRLNDSATPGYFSLPSTVTVSDGISMDEAVAISLYNNAQFQSDLAAIGIAEADLVDAGLVSNPLLRYLLPSGGLNVSGYVNFGFDLLWQRPRRIAFASAEIDRITQNMVQRGYTVIRDVQTAFADWQLALDRTMIIRENARIRGEIARLNHIRFTSGEISELEVSTVRADSAAALDELYRAGLDTILRANRLHVLMGYRPDTTIVFASSPAVFNSQKIADTTYLRLAYTHNADLRAAQLSINSAAAKMGWERSRIIAFAATVGFGHTGVGSGSALPNAFQPGIQAEVPILNRNQGRIARAQAELNQASFNYVAIRQRVQQDIADAYARYEETWKSYGIYQSEVIPKLQEAVALSQRSFERGDISYLPVLEAMRQLVNAKLRRAEIEADLRRAVAQLNFAIGKKI